MQTANPPHKATIHTRLNDDLCELLVAVRNGEDRLQLARGRSLSRLQRRDTRMMIWAMANHAADELQARAREEATAYADAVRHKDTFLNVYADLDHATGSVRLTYTFGDRDTALLFKLSKG